MRKMELFRLYLVGSLLLVSFVSPVVGYELYFLANPDFDDDIQNWYFATSTTPNQTPGTFEWSSNYGGSAHLIVSGAPSSAWLIGFTNTTIYPGDTIISRVTMTDLGNFGHVMLEIGGSWNDFCSSAHVSTPAGTYDLTIIAQRFYQPGTPIRIGIVVWPGAGEVWIHYVHLKRGGSVNIKEISSKSHEKLNNSSLFHFPMPNPSRRDVNIRFCVTEKANTTLRIYDLSGRLIKTFNKGLLEPGEYTITWNGTDDRGGIMPSGVYFYELKIGNKVTSKKLIRVR